MINKEARPVCMGYPEAQHPPTRMNKCGFTRLFKARTSRRVQVFRCRICGRSTVKTAIE